MVDPYILSSFFWYVRIKPNSSCICFVAMVFFAMFCLYLFFLCFLLLKINLATGNRTLQESKCALLKDVNLEPVRFRSLIFRFRVWRTTIKPPHSSMMCTRNSICFQTTILAMHLQYMYLLFSLLNRPISFVVKMCCRTVVTGRDPWPHESQVYCPSLLHLG